MSVKKRKQKRDKVEGYKRGEPVERHKIAVKRSKSTKFWMSNKMR